MDKAIDPADEMRASRGSAAALKMKLSILRAKIPDKKILVLEGRDDVPVYECWVKRASDDFEWEPFVSKGKGNSLSLRTLLSRDKTNLNDGVFFIIDHDYDGLRNNGDGEDIYILPGYSIENFLVTKKSMDTFLKSSLQLHSEPDLRTDAIDFYEANMDLYCQHLIRPCSILWAARRSGAKNVEAKDNVIDKFDFDSTGLRIKATSAIDSLIYFEGDLDPALTLEGSRYLNSPDLRLWIRGKYIYSYFERCCQILHADLVSNEPIIFRRRLQTKLEVGSTALARLAPAVDLPNGLREAISNWQNT